MQTERQYFAFSGIFVIFDSLIHNFHFLSTPLCSSPGFLFSALKLEANVQPFLFLYLFNMILPHLILFTSGLLCTFQINTSSVNFSSLSCDNGYGPVYIFHAMAF